jgi:hypothetical protein
LWRELEFEPVCLVLVEWVVIENLYIYEPFLKIVGRYEVYAGREAVINLYPDTVSKIDLGRWAYVPKLDNKAM